MINWSKGDQVDGAPDCVRRPEWDYHLEWLSFYPFVSEHYGHEWRMSQWEAGQDSYRTEDVSSDPDGSEFDDAAVIERRLALWLSGPDTEDPPADMILWDLCRKGVIPPGTYLITKWW